MLEHCFVRPETLDRIRSSWLGPAIDRYAVWLSARGYRARTLATRVSLLRQFGTFAQTRGAQGYEELPPHLEPFLRFWIHKPHPRRAPDRPSQGVRHARVAIEQMLRVVVPGFVGRPRRQAIREPFADRAPWFSTYLCQERGLRETTLGLYGEHLRAFAAYLTERSQGPVPLHSADSLRGAPCVSALSAPRAADRSRSEPDRGGRPVLSTRAFAPIDHGRGRAETVGRH